MKTMVVGGTWDDVAPRESKIINSLSLALGADVPKPNKAEALSYIDLQNYDLVIWAPNVDNQHNKYYPRKKKGSVLIVSKRMRKDTKEVDAVGRIFKFGGNAVITINEKKEDPKRLYFKLIDALGNIWVTSDKIEDIAKACKNLYNWTKESVRLSTTKKDQNSSDLIKLIELNRIVAEKCQKNFGERFFGNLSTRCSKMFPSGRMSSSMYFFSARNSNKEFLSVDDLVVVNDNREYIGDRKPSVDTPVQISLYQRLPNINFMTHGHAYIKGAITTKEYRPCGDLREVYEVMEAIGEDQKVTRVVVNLKNHGFILMAYTINDMEDLVYSSQFIAKGIEELC